MIWELYEETNDKEGVKEWSIFIMMNGMQHSNCAATPFKHGHWFFAHDDGDPGGLWLYEHALKAAKAEVERRNHLIQLGRRVAASTEKIK
ncbi:MAG: hypothetical protein Q8S20_22255 [Sulfuritalea sp.]|nr:hypothetical protein [Sulfuritalea sp.]